MIDELIGVAVAFDFELLTEDEQNRFLRFRKGSTRVDVWYTSGTIGVYKAGTKATFFYGLSLIQVLKEL